MSFTPRCNIVLTSTSFNSPRTTVSYIWNHLGPVEALAMSSMATVDALETLNRSPDLPAPSVAG